MNQNLNELQKRLIPMMFWFHKICKENGYRYYALGGTMLGAVRHKGFIPWDDDIDVGMPRRDYNRLIKKYGNKIIGHYYLETPYSNANDYRYPYSKLYDTRTTLIENTWPRLKRGIFIDVFPLDGFGDTEEECYKNWEKVNTKASFAWARMCAVRRNRSLLKNIAIIGAHSIPSIIINDKHMLTKLNHDPYLLDFEQKAYGGNTFGNWGKKELMRTSIMGTPKIYKFEGIEIFGAEDYEAYLSTIYGDWKKMPPKNKRITHHDFIKLNLHAGYMF